VNINTSLVFLFAGVSIVVGIFFSIMMLTPETEPFDPRNILKFRELKNQSLSQRVGAPFYLDSAFDSLHYYPPTEKERYRAEVFWLPSPEEADLMPDRPGYTSHLKSGFVVLEKETWRDSLYFYKNSDENSDSLYFIPFADLSNGRETYGGGRYLDVVLKKGKTAIMDFNFAYNPWCAYKEHFICAKIPAENHLSKAVEAGEKTYPSK
jgi:uncharacterized protein (DUF1684 family)